MIDGLTAALEDRFAVTIIVPIRGSDYHQVTVRRAMAGNHAGLILAAPGRHLLDAFTPTCPAIVLDSADAPAGLAAIHLDVRHADCSPVRQALDAIRPAVGDWTDSGLGDRTLIG